MNIDFSPMFFQGWSGIARTLLVGVLAYAGLVLLLRLSGKRTLSKMNAFDLVVTVALGSTLATILLSEDVALAEGLAAFALLIVLQFVITWLSIRSEGFQRLIKAEPALLLYQGQFLRAALRRERVAEEEVRAAVRAQKLGSLEAVEAVVLETDGSFTVLPKAGEGPDSALVGVAGRPGERNGQSGGRDGAARQGAEPARDHDRGHGGRVR